MPMGPGGTYKAVGKLGAKALGKAVAPAGLAYDAYDTHKNWDNYRRNIHGPMTNTGNPATNVGRGLMHVLSPMQTVGQAWQGTQDIFDQRNHNKEQQQNIARLQQQLAAQNPQRAAWYRQMSAMQPDSSAAGQNLFTAGQGMEGSLAQIPGATTAANVLDMGADMAGRYAQGKYKQHILDPTMAELGKFRSETEDRVKNLIADEKKKLLPWAIGGGGLMLLAPFLAQIAHPTP
jgi:hypothetical protein